MSTTLTVSINCDTDDLPKGSSGVDWVDMVTTSDYIVMSKGSLIVADGESIPSSSELTSAGLLIDGSQQICDKYFLADVSAGILKQIHNMGNLNKQYVMAFDFNGATASEPVLEAWDNASMNTITGTVLGGGVASSSWLRGITTTTSAPGADWVGSRLAGSADGYFLYLNDQNGALSVADVLYCNLKLILPASQATAIASTPILVCKYTSN